jgi:hypothetical protein
MSFLLRISSVDDVVIFKICLEYWILLVTDLYNSQKLQAAPPALVPVYIYLSPAPYFCDCLLYLYLSRAFSDLSFHIEGSFHFLSAPLLFKTL